MEAGYVVDTVYDQLGRDGPDSGLHQRFCHVFVGGERLRADTERTVTHWGGTLMRERSNGGCVNTCDHASFCVVSVWL